MGITNLEVLMELTPDNEKDPQLDPDDLAPDADEPGDEELPAELKDLVHRGRPKKDNVDKREIADRRIGT